jgi:hypothetical protein
MAALLCFVFTSRSLALSVVWFYNNWPQIAPARCARCACAQARAQRLQVTARGELDPLMNQMLQLELVDYSFKAMRASTASAHEMFDSSYYEFAGQEATLPALQKLKNALCQRLLCGCCGLVSVRWVTHASFTPTSKAANLLKKLKAWKPPSGVSREDNIAHLIETLKLPTAPGVARPPALRPSAAASLSGEASAVNLQRLGFATEHGEALFGAVLKARTERQSESGEAARSASFAAGEGGHVPPPSRERLRQRGRDVRATLWRDIKQRLEGSATEGGGATPIAKAERQRLLAKAAHQGRAPDGSLLPPPQPPRLSHGGSTIVPLTCSARTLPQPQGVWGGVSWVPPRTMLPPLKLSEVHLWTCHWGAAIQQVRQAEMWGCCSLVGRVWCAVAQWGALSAALACRQLARSNMERQKHPQQVWS